MKFNINQAIQVLEKTPKTLGYMLNGLDKEWTHNNEGDKTWSPFDVVGHLIHGEKTDWIIRTKIILNNSQNKTFESFDRFAQFKDSEGKSLDELLKEFTNLRANNLIELKVLNIKDQDLLKTGKHPELGTVTLSQLLSTWVTHDLGHIAQISRVMAKQYKDEVGPWNEYISILNK